MFIICWVFTAYLWKKNEEHVGFDLTHFANTVSSSFRIPASLFLYRKPGGHEIVCTGIKFKKMLQCCQKPIPTDSS